ncbi:MAG: hypothetical protein ACHQF4_09875 [Sphingobacteriales bacterium]
MKKNLLILGFLFFTLTLVKSAYAQNSVHVYEYWNGTTSKHFYTTDYNELGGGNSTWRLDGIIGDLYNEPGGGAVYRFYQPSSGAHYYTKNRNIYPSGFQYESILGYVSPAGYINFGKTAVYEFYQPQSGDYYYSTNSTTPGGYHLNGVSYYVF